MTWLYSRGGTGPAGMIFFSPPKKPKKPRVVSEEYFKKTVEGWKEKAEMFRIQKLGFDEAAKEMAAQNKLDYVEFLKLASKHVRAIATQEKFDIDAAQKRFMKKK